MFYLITSQIFIKFFICREGRRGAWLVLEIYHGDGVKRKLLYIYKNNLLKIKILILINNNN